MQCMNHTSAVGSGSETKQGNKQFLVRALLARLHHGFETIFESQNREREREREKESTSDLEIKFIFF